MFMYCFLFHLLLLLIICLCLIKYLTYILLIYKCNQYKLLETQLSSVSQQSISISISINNEYNTNK